MASDDHTIQEVSERMEEAFQAVKRDFATIRTGKASPTLLDQVRVEAYGAKMPLNQVATVSAPEPDLLVVQPFDPSVIGDVEKAIQAADLGLNPSNDGSVIRIPIPPLTQERREEYVRILRKMGEEGRVSVRHARRDANEELKSRMKEGELSDDDGHRLMDEVQKLTDKYSKQIDEALEAKEEEVTSL